MKALEIKLAQQKGPTTRFTEYSNGMIAILLEEALCARDVAQVRELLAFAHQHLSLEQMVELMNYVQRALQSYGDEFE